MFKTQILKSICKGTDWAISPRLIRNPTPHSTEIHFENIKSMGKI